MMEAVAGSEEEWIDSRALGRQNLQDLVGERERGRRVGRAPGLLACR